ncbi:MAG: DUF3604 domain-containing protein, partial [Myxococcota bacterium]
DAARDADLSDASLDASVPDADVPDGDVPDADVPDAEPPLIEYTENREPCADQNPLRNAYFGDLHVHTSYSFDAYVFGVRGDPDTAYRFARGEPIPLAEDGMGPRTAQIDRPLDFAAVSDHSEFLGETSLCSVEGSPSFESAGCRTYRSMLPIIGFGFFGNALGMEAPVRQASICGSDGMACLNEAETVWMRERAAAEAAYDRTSACRFTTFVAYEWTATTNNSNLHRNVIFRNASVPDLPISYFEEPTWWGLHDALRRSCIDGIAGCDAIAIPHNSNGSRGFMFQLEYPDATNEAERRQEAADRAAIEPIVELIQHKGNSECYFRPGVPGFSNDEACDFETVEAEACPPGGGDGQLFSCSAASDYTRNALGLGLGEWQSLGENPFEFGFIGSTDAHNANPGDTDEDEFQGHFGTQDGTPRDRLSGVQQEFAPGGLAGVWAVENSRDALFEAMKRRETFATSGSRIQLRFFGGSDLPENLCSMPNGIERAYRDGVPMGGELDASAGSPRFFVQAMMDEIPIQRVEIIKVWVDATGEVQEEVFTVMEDPTDDATVDLETCEPSGDGLTAPCATFVDAAFDPTLPTVYYARVLENPTCRWSQRDCNSLLFPPAYCTDPAHLPTVQERAWSSPIWVLPPR